MKFGFIPNEDFTDSLPTELLWAIIDAMGLHELLLMARVSQKWRRAAFEHRTFRTDIRLYSDTPAAVALFHAQVLRSGTNSIPNMEFRVPTDRDAVLRVVVPALTHCLHRVANLSLWIDVTCTKQPFNALRRPAPLLETFTLHIVDCQPYRDSRRNRLNQRLARMIPTDIFGGSAPLLNVFRGLGVRFPCAPAPALTGVQHVHLHGDGLRNDPASAIDRVFERDGAMVPEGPATFSTAPVERAQAAPAVSLVSDVHGVPPVEDSDGFDFSSPVESLQGEFQLQDGRLMTTANLPEAVHQHWHGMILTAARNPIFAYSSGISNELFFCPLATTTCFPAMKNLSLRGEEIRIVRSSPSSSLALECSVKLKLENLTLDLENKAHWMLRHVRAAALPSVHLVDGSPESVSSCAVHLSGPLHLRLLAAADAPSTFLAELSEQDTGRKRTFEENYATYDADAARTPGRGPYTRLNQLILPFGTYARVRALTLSQRVWAHGSVAASIPALPAAERLVFVIDVPERALAAHPLAARLRLPALRHFAVATVFEARIVQARDLVAVVGQCIVDPPQTLEFWVHEGVVVRGTFDPRNVVHVGAMPRSTSQDE